MYQPDPKQVPPSPASIATLRAALNPETPIMLLVDPLLGEPLPADAPSHSNDGIQAERESMWQRPVATIALSPRVALSPRQHPYLVELQGLNDPLLEATLDIAQVERLQAEADGLDGDGASAHRLGGWLQSSMHLPQLADHLAAMLKLNTDAPTQASYLRLADRRVAALLRYVVGDTVVSQTFGRLQSWTYLDALGQLSTLKSNGETVTPLRFNREQWARMEMGETVNRTLALWLGEANRLALADRLEAPAQTLYVPLFSAVARAAQTAKTWPHRFQQLQDQTVWAALLLLDPALEHHNAVHQLLKNTGSLDDPNEPAEPLRYLHRQIRACLADTSSREPLPA